MAKATCQYWCPVAAYEVSKKKIIMCAWTEKAPLRIKNKPCCIQMSDKKKLFTLTHFVVMLVRFPFSSGVRQN